jgi:hypothetical protein
MVNYVGHLFRNNSCQKLAKLEIFYGACTELESGWEELGEIEKELGKYG